MERRFEARKQAILKEADTVLRLEPNKASMNPWKNFWS